MKAAIWPPTFPELVAAVSNTCGIGSLAAIIASPESFEDQVERVGALTGRPFAISHVGPILDESPLARRWSCVRRRSSPRWSAARTGYSPGLARCQMRARNPEPQDAWASLRTGTTART
jgi:NAD(P)H-dependent flavin oxidoreductase YrpB (nitropropane dioxygenase family)